MHRAKRVCMSSYMEDWCEGSRQLEPENSSSDLQASNPGPTLRAGKIRRCSELFFHETKWSPGSYPEFLVHCVSVLTRLQIRDFSLRPSFPTSGVESGHLLSIQDQVRGRYSMGEHRIKYFYRFILVSSLSPMRNTPQFN